MAVSDITTPADRAVADPSRNPAPAAKIFGIRDMRLIWGTSGDEEWKAGRHISAEPKPIRGKLTISRAAQSASQDRDQLPCRNTYMGPSAKAGHNQASFALGG